MEIRTERDPEEEAAEAYAREDRCVVIYRQRACDAARRLDWPSFFAAAANCARAMNRRAAIVDAACSRPAITPGEEGLALLAA